MKPRLFPDFPVIPVDWLLSVTINSMTPAEEGAYWRLLCHAWRDEKCRLKADSNLLANLSRLGADWEKSAPLILSCFETDEEGYIYNKRQRETREAQVKRAKSGSSAARERWKKDHADASAPQCGNDANASKSHCQTHADASAPQCAEGTSTLLYSTLLNSTHTPDARALEAELPPRFPKTEAEAKAFTAQVGCPAEFAVKVWERAAARGGQDSKGVTIANFHHHLASCWRYERERIAREKPAAKVVDPNDWRQSL